MGEKWDFLSFNPAEESTAQVDLTLLDPGFLGLLNPRILTGNLPLDFCQRTTMPVSSHLDQSSSFYGNLCDLG